MVGAPPDGTPPSPFVALGDFLIHYQVLLTMILSACAIMKSMHDVGVCSAGVTSPTSEYLVYTLSPPHLWSIQDI